MGLFRSRARRKREKAAAELTGEPVKLTGEPAKLTGEPAKLTAKVATLTEEAAAKLTEEPAKHQEEQAGVVMAQEEAKHRQVIAEARPNPDKPGWGRIAGQAIGKAHEDRRP